MTNHTKAVHCKKVKADIYIGRGSRFGNPFPLHDESMRDGVIQQFSDWIIHQPELLRLVRQLLSGKTLGCFCAPKACHGDVLAAIADGHWDHAIPEPPVFVYGSNRMGINGKGAVKGVARGLNGNAYAIPTKDEQLSTLPINAIREEVDQFIDHARRHPEVSFLLTRIGCGLAGYTDQDIAPFFKHASANIMQPGLWLTLNHAIDEKRIIVAGGRDFKDYAYLSRKLDKLLGNLDPKSIVIVSGGATGADTLGERYCIERGYRLRRFPAEWESLGKPAGHLRNQLMAHFATHLVAFWDGMSRGTGSMISIGEGCQLNTRVCRY